MASIERTAYPRFPRVLTAQDLLRLFSPISEEIEWVSGFARSPDSRLALMVQLKCFQYLHYFCAIDEIPPEIIEHVCACLGVPPQRSIRYPNAHRSLYRHHEAIRKLLGVRPFSGADAYSVAERSAEEVSRTVNTRNDIINIVIAELMRFDYELPSFSTLVKIAEKAHEAAEQWLYKLVFTRLSESQKNWLEDMLVSDLSGRTTRYNDLKQSAKKTSRQHLNQLLEQLNWLEAQPDCERLLESVPATRLKYLAEMAAVMDAAELKDTSQPKRATLILALIHRMRVRVRDDIAEMFIRRMGTCNKRAKEELETLQAQQRDLSEDLVATFEEVLALLALNLGDEETGRRVRELLAPFGSLDELQRKCEAIRAWSGKNYLPLLWKPFSSWRVALFKMARAFRFEAATQDRRLVDALALVLPNEHRKSDWLKDVVDLSFASERWRTLVIRDDPLRPTNRRFLEVCVFSYLSRDLRSGDIFIEGSESFADDRKQLLPWCECEKQLAVYCDRVGIDATPQACCDTLRQLLADTASDIDRDFPHRSNDVTISSSGEPTVKRTEAKEIPASAISLQATISNRIVPRNLLDILRNIDDWTGFTRHFGPLSGSDPKLRDARARYLLTTFSLGTGLGVNQAARHLANQVSAHQLSFANRHHMSIDQIEAAQRDLAELYLRLPLPRFWGDGSKVSADGSPYDFYDQNLLVGMHYRYRKMGAVAYRHVANNYIAVFRHFIPPGVLEALYVIEGLQKAGLSVEADTVYSDTHGQSEIMFAFSYLVGIQLMPRIRGWKDLKFYRPDEKVHYTHIDSIFTDVINWQLIQDHWQDLMQIAISIQAGRIASPLLLRKLSNESRYNRLFAAARELGRVLRTIYLLRWINSKEMRQEVTGETNKIESYHAFTQWLNFGGEVITENDPVEQQKRLRYIDLVASSVILQNTVDMMRVMEDLQADGVEILDSDKPFLSPYGTNAIKRFGNFHLDMKRPQEPWLRNSQLREAASLARAASDKMQDGAPSKRGRRGRNDGGEA